MRSALGKALLIDASNHLSKSGWVRGSVEWVSKGRKIAPPLGWNHSAHVGSVDDRNVGRKNLPPIERAHTVVVPDFDSSFDGRSMNSTT